MTEADRISTFANVPHELAEIVVMEAGKSGHTIRAIRGSCRARHLVTVRSIISKAAHDAGFSYPQIGRAINRDHTSIIHLVRRMMGEQAR